MCSRRTRNQRQYRVAEIEHRLSLNGAGGEKGRAGMRLTLPSASVFRQLWWSRECPFRRIAFFPSPDRS